MAYTAPTTRAAGDVIDYQIWNDDLVENIKWLHSLISDTELGSAAASIDITSIPQTYKHLLIYGSVRTDNAATNDLLRMRANGNSTADDYATQRILANNASVSAAETVTNETSAYIGVTTAATAAAKYFAGFTLWIYDYANASKAPTWVSLTSRPIGVATTNMQSTYYIGVLDVAGAVDQLTFFPSIGSNLADKSRITLMGVR